VSGLRQVVERHIVRPSHAGPSVTSFDRTAIQRELVRMRRSRELGFWLLFVLFAILLFGALVIVVQYRTNPGAIQRISAATGVTLMGVMAAMVRLWAQKVRTDLVMAVVAGMPEEAMRAVLTTLIPKL